MDEGGGSGKKWSKSDESGWLHAEGEVTDRNGYPEL